MKTTKTLALTFSLTCFALSLTACGGSGGETESQHEGDHHAGGEVGPNEENEAHGHGSLPAAVHEFHEVLAPIWHAEAGDTRRDLACSQDAHESLEAAADDVEAMGAPEGVDENEWNAAADELAADVDALAGACEAGGEEAEAKLTEIHHAFHAVVDLLGHESRGASEHAEDVAEHGGEADEGTDDGSAP